MKNSFFLIISLLLLLIFNGCNTKPKTSMILGKAIMTNDSGDPSNDPGDFSGVIVALYSLAELDTTLIRINYEYPQIGVQIRQETEFDHRNAEALKIVQTGADGSFKIESVEPGTYHLVMMKEDWGIRYLYNVSVAEGENKNIGDIELYPARSFASSITDDVVLETGHTYLIENDANFIGSVTVGPGARIYVSPGCLVRFYGEVVTPSELDMGEPWKILSGKNLYSTIPTNIGSEDYYSSVSFFEDTPVIRSGIIHHVSNAIAINGSHCELSDMILRYCGSGFMFSQGDITLTNSIVAYGIDNQTNFGVSVQAISGHTQVSENIYNGMYEALIINTQGSFSVTNSYFSNNYRGIYVRNNTGNITNNEFDMNSFDISPGHYSIPQTITYNNFYCSQHTGIRPIGRAIINNNNFYRTNNNFINIFSSDLPNNSTVPEDLDATNNYWGVSDVDDFLYDALDNQDHPDEPCEFYIDYTPRRSSPVTNAGIE